MVPDSSLLDTGEYKLDTPGSSVRRLAASWLVLGVAALAASGLYSLLIVLSRTPLLHQIIPWNDFFHTALVVHVDLSVLIWFLAFAGVIWTLSSSQKLLGVARLAFYLTTLGTLFIVLAPFSGEGHPMMNNYIPVLQNPVFYAGLALVGTGFSLLTLRSLLSPDGMGIEHGGGVLRLGAYASAACAAVSLIALFWSWWQLQQLTPEQLPQGKAYFEYLFWGGGHVLQFTHTVLLLLAWIWLLDCCDGHVPGSSRINGVLIVLVAVPVLLAFAIYANSNIISVEHRLGFTELMRWGGLTSLPLGLIVVWGSLRVRRVSGEVRPMRNALYASIILFAMGGVLAFMIKGVNVVIPAHYHGSIVGVTLAFMGLSYYLMPMLGFRKPDQRLASWQPWVYGGGQLMHILGLAWSGGYGVKRKTAGAAQQLDRLPEILGMGMMGLGGLIAIIGGLLFIIVALRSMWPARHREGLTH